MFEIALDNLRLLHINKAYMNWYNRRKECRQNYIEAYNSDEAEIYEEYPDCLHQNAHAAIRAYVEDFNRITKIENDSILEIGAGTGSYTKVFTEGYPSSDVTVLEPSKWMLKKFTKSYPNIKSVNGGCDQLEDLSYFSSGSFNLITCRCVVNGLVDPLQAFSNWHKWLKPDGKLLVVESLFSRDNWTGAWKNHIDTLPLAGHQSRALLPYLLEHIGFKDIQVEWMSEVNDVLEPGEKARYVVFARKSPK